MAQYIQVGDEYIEFPDNMSDDQIRSALKNYTPSPNLAAPASMGVEQPQQQLLTPEQAPPVQPKAPQQGGGVWDTVKGIPSAIYEQVTGAQRSTPETQSLPGVEAMPEMNELLSIPAWKVAAGTLMTDPQETMQIFQSNFPNNPIRQDEKGNYIIKSNDGNEYALKPGFGKSDVGRVIGTAAAFAPAGRVAGLGRGILADLGTQAAIEGVQAATGGNFNPGEVITAGVSGGLLRGATKAVPAVKAAFSQAPVEDASRVAPMTSESIQDAAKMVKGAATDGGAGKQSQKLAQELNPNVTALKAQERLGMELPPDVFSQNKQLQAIAGLTRSEVGSVAEATWRQKVVDAANKADELIQKSDAIFEGTGPSVAGASREVRESLKSTRNQLNKDATVLYDEVNQAVPKQTVIEMNNLQKTLDEVVSEVGKGGMTAQEKRLMSMISGEESVTYGRLIREKNLIGKAIAGKESPYGSLDESTLKRLYGALAEDQIENVGRVGGDELSAKLKSANAIYSKERELGSKIVKSFGEDLDGSIGRKLIESLKSAATGDSKKFTEIKKLMAEVPDDLKKETWLTAIASATRSKSGNSIVKGGFGFSEFTDLYKGIRNNKEVYADLAKTIGPDASKLMRDLYEVSRHVTSARANVLMTGKSNQALIKETIQAQNLIGKVLNSVAGESAVTGAAGLMGPAAGLVPLFKKAMSGGGKDAMDKAGKLLISEEFKDLVAEAVAKGIASDRAVKRVAVSKAFGRFANEIKIPREMNARTKWIMSAMKAQQNTQEDQK